MTTVRLGKRKLTLSIPALLLPLLMFLFLFLRFPIPVHFITNLFLSPENAQFFDLTWYQGSKYGGIYLLIGRMILDSVILIVLYLVFVSQPTVQKMLKEPLTTRRLILEILLGLIIVILFALISPLPNLISYSCSGPWGACYQYFHPVK